MNSGNTLLSQVMDFLPSKTLHRIVARYRSVRRVRTLTCAEQFRGMAFAQLTYRESLRDIEVRLSAQADNLYHMGFRQRSAVPRWPMPTNGAAGAPTPTLPSD